MSVLFKIFSFVAYRQPRLSFKGFTNPALTTDRLYFKGHFLKMQLTSKDIATVTFRHLFLIRFLTLNVARSHTGSILLAPILRNDGTKALKHQIFTSIILALKQ